MKRLACFIICTWPAGACAPAPGAKCAQEAPATASQAWGGSTRRRFVAIRPVGSETFEDFPVLVRLDPQHIDYAACADKGPDLRFADRPATVLSHEIEEWHPVGRRPNW